MQVPAEFGFADNKAASMVKIKVVLDLREGASSLQWFFMLCPVRCLKKLFYAAGVIGDVVLQEVCSFHTLLRMRGG